MRSGYGGGGKSVVLAEVLVVVVVLLDACVVVDWIAACRGCAFISGVKMVTPLYANFHFIPWPGIMVYFSNMPGVPRNISSPI